MNGTVSVENLSWPDVVAPLLVAVVVGVGSSYVTTRVQIGSIEERMSATESDIVRLRQRADQRQNEAQQLYQRIVRMETKIDLLIQAEGIETPRYSRPSPNSLTFPDTSKRR